MLCLRTLSLGLLVCAQHAVADDTISNLKSLSLQDLSTTTVSIAAKNQQPINETPSAVFVINHEEIRRSGMQSIPELLRKVPGLEVARVDANQWAISSRGFNGTFANKLLVMIDGRTVYDPLNSGVFWNEQDYPLEDIDRIEVIRGPGATLWGSNAVNGVINIITRSARESQGALLSTGSSQEEPAFSTFRYGGQLNPDFHYRVYGKYNHRDDFHFSNGDKANDGLDMGRVGFRSDWSADSRKNLTLQGDYFNGNMGQGIYDKDATPISADIKKSGGNLLLRWEQSLRDDSRLQVRSYFDHADRDLYFLEYRRNTFDFDVQHNFVWQQRHNLTWGAGYRYNGDQVRQKNSSSTYFEPAQRDVHLFNIFVQDEWRFWEDQWRLIYGSKIEHNDFTGFEVQPSARILWQADQQHSLWAGVSRSVRVPNRADHNVNASYTITPGLTANAIGSSAFVSETALTYELGHRFAPNEAFNIDNTWFYSDYGHLSTTEPQAMQMTANGLIIPMLISNKAYGETYGWETAINWRASESWRLQGSYSLFSIALHSRADSLDSTAQSAETVNAKNRFNISSYLNLPYQLEFDSHWYYTDALLSQVPAYHRLDLRLGWQPNLHFELAVGAQNLLDNRHFEFNPALDNATISSAIERNFYCKATVRY